VRPFHKRFVYSFPFGRQCVPSPPHGRAGGSNEWSRTHSAEARIFRCLVVLSCERVPHLSWRTIFLTFTFSCDVVHFSRDCRGEQRNTLALRKCAGIISGVNATITSRCSARSSNSAPANGTFAVRDQDRMSTIHCQLDRIVRTRARALVLR